MKLLIRILLVLASICMTVANLKNGYFALSASILFLLANVLSLIYNELKKIRNVKDLQIEMIKVWSEIKRDTNVMK